MQRLKHCLVIVAAMLAALVPPAHAEQAVLSVSR